MDRRNFSKKVMTAGAAIPAVSQGAFSTFSENAMKEDVSNLPVRQFDVIVAGGGTAGVVAAIAAGRFGSKTALIEGKGYAGGTVVEGGTAAAICAGKKCTTRELPYKELRSSLEKENVYLEN